MPANGMCPALHAAALRPLDTAARGGGLSLASTALLLALAACTPGSSEPGDAPADDSGTSTATGPDQGSTDADTGGTGAADESSGADSDDTTGAPPPPADPPAVQWQVGLGTDREEHVHEGHQTSDGGFVMIGHHAEGKDLGGPSDILVIKTDDQGTEQWQRIIGTAGAPDVGYAVAETADGFVLAVGLAEGGRQRPALIGLDSAGDTTWERDYGDPAGTGHGGLRDVQVLDDGSLVATGYDASPEDGFLFIADDAEGLLLRTDPDGTPQWERTYEIPQGTKVLPTADGFVILSTAWVKSGGADVQNMVLLFTDPDGFETIRSEIGGANNIQAFDFDTAPGGYILAGHTTGYDTANWDCAVARVDAKGLTQWVGTFGNPRGYDPAFIHDECYGVRSLPGGGFVAVGGSGDEYRYSEDTHQSGSSDEWKSYVIRLDDGGALVYEGIYGGSAGPGAGNNAAEFLALTADGGMALFTDTDSDGTPQPNNFGLVKLAPPR